jgi:hypothetical protein
VVQGRRLLRQTTFHLQGQDTRFLPSLVPLGYRLATTNESWMIIGLGLEASIARALLFRCRE